MHDSLAPPPVSRLPLIAIGIQPQWEGRYFRHTEFTAPNVRSYDANGYASLALAVELFPLARFGSKWWAGFGVAFEYARAFGFDSDSTRLADIRRRETGEFIRALPVDTSFSRYAAGLRYRILLNPNSQTPFVFTPSASLVAWNFDFGSELPRAPDLETPIADDRMIRLRFDASFRVRALTFFTSLGYLHAFAITPPGSRELGDLEYPHLPTAVGMGGEARIGMDLAIWRWLGLRVSAEYALLAFHLAPLPGRQDRSARVVDRYAAAGLGPYVSF